MSTDMVFNAMRRERQRDEVVTGMVALVHLYYDNYTDATCIESDLIRLIDRVLNEADCDIDAQDLIAKEEAYINESGGVRSDTDGSRHNVCTYPDDGNEEVEGQR